MIYQTEETRENILRASEALFLERGFFQTQMKDVAEAVGISRNTLYRYYRDKGDLGLDIFNIVIGRMLDQFLEVLEEVSRHEYGNARERLIAVLEQLGSPQQNATELLFISEFDAYYSADRIPEDFHSRQDLSRWGPVENALKTILQEGVADGSLRDDMDPDMLLWLLLTVMRLMQRELVARSAALSLPPDRVGEIIPTLLRLLSDGLKPQNFNNAPAGAQN